MHTYEVNIGVDVSKETLAAAFPDGRVTPSANDRRGLKVFMGKIKGHGAPVRVCREAAGGYGQPLADACHAAGVAVTAASPRQVRGFARGKGLPAKADAIGARLTARFAAGNNPRPTGPQPQWQRRPPRRDPRARGQGRPPGAGQRHRPRERERVHGLPARAWRRLRQRAPRRRVLWMAATAAARFSPTLRAFDERLRGRGKPHKVAIVAAIRKLVCLANKILTNPSFVPA